ncbi:glutathione-dependent reductase [Sphaerisporangium melleum]|uniref:Glutathione-dependent reductase n=1 Tax=Sphaerisporangium melleum TaxID=321316 RepID=A0A917RHM6_9ACTN|nr:glutathione S-transferase family protein [Sphaerisporangium melleum]GGL08866.1 glutathione-dependent reductase [Sphaerisporangium melleum]GII68778.1 glutathione-dependent reductase [Sphaerisporangium melleum]
MTGTAAVASPVDFAVHGDYGIKNSNDTKGAFTRPPYGFRGRITADGSSGYPAEPGRYHLYVSLACPWAHRSVIVRALKGLEDVVSMSVLDPVRDGRGWAFREGPGHTADPVNGFTLLREAYEASEPGYDGHVSVPVLWDRRTGGIVSNNFPDISIDLGTQFGQWARDDIDLYPAGLRPEIDALNDRVYAAVNNGVYRCGFATGQQAYDEAVRALFAMLDELEERLGAGRYLFGDRPTEADVRLWVTLVRFDAVYVTHFKANLRRLADHPNLWAYARDLYQHPAFGGTTDFDHIKRHYYTTHPQLNPSRIVPAGPLLDWDAPHGRG